MKLFSINGFSKSSIAKVNNRSNGNDNSVTANNQVECYKLPHPVVSSDIETVDFRVPGVLSTVVGYAGGKKDWPTYRNILDYTEAIRLEFDPKVISYEDILDKFFADCSPISPSFSRQYRSAILYHNSIQKEKALKAVQKYQRIYNNKKIYVDIEPSTDFYRAEEYHQKYVDKHSYR